jgi:hypothetical protein
MNDLPFVRKGQPVTAALWNQLSAAMHACRLIAGDGVRPREMPNGTIITFDGVSAEFVHPFQVSLIGTEAASIRPGTVNKMDAKIKDVPLAGKGGEASPVLKIETPVLDDEGHGCICVEATRREEDWSVEKVEVAQVADPNTDDGESGEGHSGSTASVALPERRTRQRRQLVLRVLLAGAGFDGREWRNGFEMGERNLVEGVIEHDAIAPARRRARTSGSADDP